MEPGGHGQEKVRTPHTSGLLAQIQDIAKQSAREQLQTRCEERRRPCGTCVAANAAARVANAHLHVHGVTDGSEERRAGDNGPARISIDFRTIPEDVGAQKRGQCAWQGWRSSRWRLPLREGGCAGAEPDTENQQLAKVWERYPAAASLFPKNHYHSFFRKFKEAIQTLWEGFWFWQRPRCAQIARSR